MRTRYAPRNRRRILCVSPRYAPSFGTFHYSYPLFGGRIRAFMPPQGLLVIAAYLPGVVGGALRGRERARGRPPRSSPGPTRSSSPACTCSAPSSRTSSRAPTAWASRWCWAAPRSRAARSTTRAPISSRWARWATRPTRSSNGSTGTPAGPRSSSASIPGRALPLTEFPLPAYHLIALPQYFISSIQFSSGCPYSCEFCDIPALYGRNPRLKTAAQVLAELDALVAGGAVDHLLRGRQLHREPEGRAGAAAPPGRVAAAQPVPGALRVRGHAEHREERAGARPDARRRVLRGVLRDRDARARARSARCRRTRTSACRSSRRSPG